MKGKRLGSIFVTLAMLLAAMPAVPAGASGIGYNDETSDTINIVKTDIIADGVFNEDGYGSLKLNPVYKDNGWEYESIPQAALIDRNGDFIFPYKDTFLRYHCFDDVVSLTAENAYSHYYIDYSVSDDVGFYSLDGEPLFTGDFFGATPMREGYAFVTEFGEYGATPKSYLIDKTGKTVLELHEGFSELAGAGFGDYIESYEPFSMAIWFSEGLLPCWTYASFDDYCNQKLQSIFYIDINGQTALTLSGDIYKNFRSFYEGLACVRSRDTEKTGYIDKSGNLVIPCEYESLSDFNDGLAPVSKNGKYGYINKNNETVIPFEYDSAYGAGNGLASVVKDGKCGLVDYNNNVVVPLEYDDISSYDNGIAYAIKDRYVYLITGYSKSNTSYTNTAVSVKDGLKTFTVSPNGIGMNDTVILALHKNGVFMGLQSALYNGEDVIFESDTDCDSAKVLVWGSFKDLKPVTEAEIINADCLQ